MGSVTQSKKHSERLTAGVDSDIVSHCCMPRQNRLSSFGFMHQRPDAGNPGSLVGHYKPKVHFSIQSGIYEQFVHTMRGIIYVMAV